MLSNQVDEIFSLLLADDVAQVSHNVRGLQNHLDVLACASAKLRLKVNLDETKIMVFREGGQFAAHEKMVHKWPTARGSKFVGVCGLHIDH